MLLIIDRPQARLTHERGVLRIDAVGEPTRRVPVGQLETVIIYGNPLAETGLWRALSAANVAVVMLPARAADGAAVLAGGLAATLPLRRLQHQCAADSQRALALARWVVGHKLAGYDLPLRALDARHRTDPVRRDAFLARRDAAREALAAAPGIDALMGIEGQMANAWFGLLAATLAPAWNFTGRNRRPPRDPVNALLSLGYTLVGAEVHQAVMAAGLDPSLGFLHQPVPGREAMVLDLTEVFRGGVDHFVLSFLDPAGPDQRDWYYRDDTGCRLAKAARPRWYQAWAEARAAWPYPIGGPGADWPVGALREQIHGWIERLRAAMK